MINNILLSLFPLIVALVILYFFIKFFEKIIHKDIVKNYKINLTSEIVNTLEDVKYKTFLKLGIDSTWSLLKTHGKVLITDREVVFIPMSLLNSHRTGILGRGFRIFKDNSQVIDQKLDYQLPSFRLKDINTTSQNRIVLLSDNPKLGDLTVHIFGKELVLKISTYLK